LVLGDCTPALLLLLLQAGQVLAHEPQRCLKDIERGHGLRRVLSPPSGICNPGGPFLYPRLTSATRRCAISSDVSLCVIFPPSAYAADKLFHGDVSVKQIR
jgi:hypothetical protein